jgi:protein-disulfide isomerase
MGAADHVLGPPDAPVKVVEYGDFECPNCKQAAPAVKQLLAHFAGKVQFAYRHFPVEATHPNALRAAESSEAAAAQNRFWEMHDLLFDNQNRLQRRDLEKYAGLIALDMSLFGAALNGHSYLPLVQAQLDTGRRSGVRSTPAFFVNNKIHDVSFGLRSLFDAVDAALSKETR